MQILPTARCVLASVLLTLAAGSAIAQQKPASVPISVDQKWEYIVVTYGKTEFGSPQKTLAYRAIGLPAGQEAEDLQNNLDILGRFGWETVAFVGSIGGDQEIILKRKYDKNRAASETEAIARGTALYIKDMVDILEREQKLREESRLAEEEARNKPHLIDLDAEEAKIARANALTALRTSYTEALKTSDPTGVCTITVEYSNTYSSDVDVEIKVDLTRKFLKEDGKSYRLSEVSQYLKSNIIKYRFIDNRHTQDADVRIIARGFIQFDEKPVQVYMYMTRYSHILKQWM